MLLVSLISKHPDIKWDLKTKQSRSKFSGARVCCAPPGYVTAPHAGFKPGPSYLTLLCLIHSAMMTVPKKYMHLFLLLQFKGRPNLECWTSFERIPICLISTWKHIMYMHSYMHRRRSRGRGGGGGGGHVSPPPLEFFWGGGSSPLDFWKLEKYLFIYLHFKHNESNTKRLIQHKNTTKHTKSLNLPRASRADSRPYHISAYLALPAISVAGGGGRAGRQSPPPQ